MMSRGGSGFAFFSEMQRIVRVVNKSTDGGATELPNGDGFSSLTRFSQAILPMEDIQAKKCNLLTASDELETDI